MTLPATEIGLKSGVMLLKSPTGSAKTLIVERVFARRDAWRPTLATSVIGGRFLREQARHPARGEGGREREDQGVTRSLRHQDAAFQ